MTSTSKKFVNFQRKLKKIERKSLDRAVQVPDFIEAWESSLTKDELGACTAFLSIPEADRPSDMLNPSDIVHQRLGAESFQWAHKHEDKARSLFEKHDSDVPRWCSILAGIMNYEARVLAGIAHELPEGEPPLHWSQFTDSQPWARPPGFVEPLNPTKDYRKKI